jgi:mono/diheme cytochrome c family protein
MVIGRGLLATCILAVAGGMAVTNVIGLADTAKPVMSAKAKRGAAIFQQNCVSCHNKQPDDTTPFGPPNLHGILSSKPMVTPAPTVAQVTETIKNGKAPMPAFGSILTDAQINDLLAYLKVQ